ncbi:MmgE/PrpD family protein [Saccharopolyspora griseoalba]|uniref:MmgE/PrpD family protein n=1 Tax=Saccharopolyspora griseoalba TaxID=1431848 RepID=A0ABW2LEK5_9PSEU
MASIASSLAQWATGFEPTEEDLALARRSLLDTTAVALAAREHPATGVAAGLPEAARWAVAAHVLDFDDLHVGSTAHVSAVIVPAVLASGGEARAYLAGAGVMARLGNALGWSHYTAGWHATCTAGAPAAAVAASAAMGLPAERLAIAMALAVPAAGGVREAFGTHGKSLQVGFAADAGVRAARLAAAGATADPRAVDAWFELVGGRGEPELAGPAVPGGLAIKVFPCCYAMQRPIAALREIREQVRGDVLAVRVRTPKSTVTPLIHDRPVTGLQAKFSMPYAVATALLDDYPDFAAFTDEAVNRPAARRLMRGVAADYPDTAADGLLAGEVVVEVEHDGATLRVDLAHPPGAPARPPTGPELADKLAACGEDVPGLLADPDWARVRELLSRTFPPEREGASR